MIYFCSVFFSSRRRHTRFDCDWSSDVCSSDLPHSALRTHASFPLFRRQWVHLVQDADGFQNYAARDFQTLRAELVHRVLGCVPEHIVIAIHKIDDVGGRHSALHKWDVIIADLILSSKEMRLIPKASGGLIDRVFEPR